MDGIGVLVLLALVVSAVVGYFVLIERIRQTCPKCTAKKSFKSINWYQEPRSTYERKSATQPADHSYTNMDVYETGVEHDLRKCSACGHEQEIKRSYTKRIRGSQR
jgi:Zn ribbon nucleic-acid-binding protein